MDSPALTEDFETESSVIGIASTPRASYFNLDTFHGATPLDQRVYVDDEAPQCILSK